ncbi:MAG: hypothetical protein Q8K04_01970 [Lutibacter sp.]|nr:hypothetical protein [Lutibacter sp.]MDP3944861.1 hypothetical protein [Lutibacter sp.]
MKRAQQILIHTAMINDELACGKQACLSGRQAASVPIKNKK